ncbi:hypothetical protein [Pantoea vagans]|uniref:hypothetical protein n=1 Tax=Pantoea vagans TaxID=470934 RepID=UPI00366D1200
MKKLKSITLSNIRRYGAETKIELSQGATILLAPNGTGKTAFFEAIELSLTGKISRLGENLLPIIRDQQSQAKVTLDFGDVSATAEVSAQGKVKRSGDLRTIFPETMPDDIPFLLRLTHLLDQREAQWLVKADAKIAGAQLERLPIGKDGAQVNSALGSIRRVLGDKLKQANTALGALQTEYEEWKSLVLDRDTAVSQSQGALRSKESIAESIADIARRTQSSEHLPAGLLVPPLGVDSLGTINDALEQTVQAKLNKIREQIKGLAEVDGIIDRFVAEQARSEKLGNEFVASRLELTQKQEECTKITHKQTLLQQEQVKEEGLRDSIAKQLNRLNIEKQTKATVELCQQVLASADKALEEADSLAKTFQSIYEANEKLTIEHDLINQHRKALLLVDTEIQTAQQLIKRWEENLQRVASITTSITYQESQETILQTRLDSAFAIRTNAEAEVQTLKQVHESLNSTADIIRQSVATIAAHLPADRGDCPLCGEPHGAERLHTQINKALEAIDPDVVDAERRVKTASDRFIQCTEAVTKAKAELEVCQRKIRELKTQQAQFTADINQLKTDILLDGDSVQLANEALRRRQQANESARLQIDQKQRNLAPPPTPEGLEASRSSYQTAKHSLESARQSRAGALTSLEQSAASLSAIIADAPPSKTLAELSVKQNKNSVQLNDIKNKIAAEQSALERQQVKLNEATGRHNELEKQILDAQNKLSTIRYSWRQLSFSGDPIAEVARSKEAQLQSSVTDLSRQTDQLQTLKIEIGAWSKLEQTRITQGLIDRRRGDSSEEEFVANLRQKIDNGNSAQTQLMQLSEAMESLSSALSTEIENVHKYVMSVVPRWQALLKRVVREQRFAGTNLGLRTMYRKGHAEVFVPLHGDSAPVPAIASEAQLTDLQLTFLLSMALEHKWSSWQGLLLDDPTQHHDLVHAASVFDLLRDYIVDHGFQVVIATHDALQARYFMRKLQNDGIEARLWSLAPTPEGVTASELQINR